MATLKRLNKETGTYEVIPVGGGVPEAPVDNKPYARKDGKWVIVETPTKTSDLTNDSGFLTEHQDISGLATKTELNKKVDKVDGKQLSTEDFTTLLKQKLDGLSNYDDTEISQAVSKLRTDLDTLVSGDTTTAIKTFNEVIAFLDGLEDTEDLASIIASIEQQIAAKYTKPSTGIPKTDLASDVQTSLNKADTALQSYTEQYKGTVTGVKMNGTTKNPSSGVVDLGTVITSHQDLSGYQPKLVSGTNIKTINGESIVGSGDIVISSGSSSGDSGSYAEVNHGTSDTAFTLTPNTFHVWDEVASLDLSLAEEQAGVANEYLFQFTSGSTATTLTLPDSIKWANDSAPTISENMIYQISVLKGLASVLEFNKVSLIFFTVNYTGKTFEYTAEEGMTWGQWIESSYNFEGATVTSNGKILFSSYSVNGVTKDDEIISNYIYNTSYYD